MCIFLFLSMDKKTCRVRGRSSGLIVFPFSCCFRFLLALYARLLVMLSLANLLLNAGLRAVSLESAQSAI